MSEYSAHEPMQQHLRSRLTRTVEALRKNRFDACWVATKEEALEEVILSLLRSGAYQYLDREAVPREEVPALYRKAFSADFYLMSSNAVTENGELYNVDGNGNRVAALIYGPERVIVVAGANKLTADVPEAVRRVKTIAAPVNAMRLHCDTPCTETGACAGIRGGTAAGCRSEQRICVSYLVSAYQRMPDRVKVILVAETLGY